MPKRFFIRFISSLTLFFFFSSLFLPSYALAHNEGYWSDGGQVMGPPMFTSNPPENPQLKPEPPKNPCYGADPVYLHSGEFFYECEDLVIPGRGMPALPALASASTGRPGAVRPGDVVIKHLYRSGKAYNGQFGYGWTMSYYERLQPTNAGTVVIINGRGRRDEYTPHADGTYHPPAGLFESLVQNEDGSWTLTDTHGGMRHFNFNGTLSSIEDRHGNRITFVYDPAGLLPIVGVSGFSQVPGERSLIGYDYRLIQIIDTVGRPIDLTYNPDGRLEKIIDFAGREVKFVYDPASDDLLTITKPATTQYPQGVTKTFTYTSQHQLETITDARDKTFVANHYDNHGRVYQQDWGAGSVVFSYAQKETTMTDRKGYVTVYDFNANGNVIREETLTKDLRPDDPDSFITKFSYNSDMLKKSVTYPRGNGIKYVYDEANSNPRARGNVLEIRYKPEMGKADNDTNDRLIKMTYEPYFNFPKTVSDAKGNVTTYTYDYELPRDNPRYSQKGDLVTITYPTVPEGTPKVELTYNSSGQIIQLEDPNHYITKYEYYSDTGYLKQIQQDPSGINAITQLTWGIFGFVDTVTDPNDHITNYNFDALGWLTRVTNPLNYVTKYSQDANGNITKIERQENEGASEWQTTEFTYNILNDLKTIQDPLNRITTYDYDKNQNLQSIVDAELNTTIYEYDERNRLFKIKDANAPQGVTQYDYDKNGNLKKITDANGNPTQYAFDLFDRIETMTYADGTIEGYSYDKNNNLTEVKTPNVYPQAGIKFDYDALNRLTAKRFPQNPTLNAGYSYDLGSRLESANTAAAQNSFIYDALNRMKTVANTLPPTTYNLAYEYDKAGNRTKVTYPSGKIVEYTYDGNDRMDAVKINSVPTVDYTYDPLDRRSQKDYLSGVPQQTIYGFDIANQLKTLTNKFTAGGNISQFGYPDYDNVGNRLTMTTEVVAGFSPRSNAGSPRTLPALAIASGGPGKGAATDSAEDESTQTTTYGYNDIYEITSVAGAQTHAYDYDGVGNRKTTDGVTYVPNTLNQYDSVGGVTFSYDLNGNLSDDGPNGYTYDEENRLTTVITPTTSPPKADQPLADTAYSYDALGRRVSKTVDGTTTYFIYDEFSDIEERDASGNLDASYVYGAKLDEVLTMERGGETYFYHQDGLGSVSDLTDDQGNVVERTTYDVYGQPSIFDISHTPLAISSIDNPFLFTGRRFDDESGLYYYRRRYYDPKIGRFLSRDPLGYVDSPNPYVYALNNPINYIDPYGLWTLQLGFSLNPGLRWGYTVGGGIVISYSRDAGFVLGGYTVFGGGSLLGGSVSGTLDLSISGNESACQLKGQATTLGGSGQFGISGSFGGEINLPHDPNARASYTGSIGIGAGTPEGHMFITRTDIYPWITWR